MSPEDTERDALRIPYFAIDNTEIAQISQARLCNPAVLKCRECGKLLELVHAEILIIGNCRACDKQYLVAMEIDLDHPLEFHANVRSGGKQEGSG